MVAQRKVILLPKLRMQFAEFLQHHYLNHLSILYPLTCVGLRYGLYVRAISWSHTSSILNPIREYHHSNPSLPTGQGILTLFPSTTPFGLVLGTD